MIIPPSTNRLLVIAPSWIGDSVMASVIYRAARNACPNASITIAGRAILRPLFDGAPWLDQFQSIDTSGLLGPRRAGKELAADSPEAVIVLPGSFRSALTARWTGAPCRVGTARDARRLLLTHALPHPDRSQPVSAVEHYRRIAAACFGENAATDTSLALHVTDHDHAEADRILGQDQRPLLLLVPGANRADKRWPTDRFVDVANALASSHQLRAVIAGSPDETTLTSKIAAGITHDSIDGPTTGMGLGALKAIAARACIAISNDTGPRHIAAAMNTPVVSLFGPTDHRWTTLPSARERCLLGDPFLPEDEVADDQPQRCSIDHIMPTDVLAAARALLDESTSTSA
ncbi:MAG: lipopolysaccharide heptosyltransferase II [Phycisphaerales bacterium]|nr:lipopolysaccharide heptosyltransferase II [Phycisphaerales bacterium]